MKLIIKYHFCPICLSNKVRGNIVFCNCLDCKWQGDRKKALKLTKNEWKIKSRNYKLKNIYDLYRVKI